MGRPIENGATLYTCSGLYRFGRALGLKLTLRTVRVFL